MPNDKPLRVAIFASVSSPQQAEEDKDSLPSQIRDGRAWAEARGWRVVAVYEVPGHSRQYGFYDDAARDIPAYGQLREDARNGKFDVLWCRDRSRLGRTRSLVAQVEYVVEAGGGAEVYSAAMPHAVGKRGRDGAGKLIAAVEGWRGEHEIDVLVHRHRTGIRARVHRGVHPSNWPYGYRPIRDEEGRCIGAELEEGEAQIMRRVTRRFLDGAGYRAIAIELNDDGVPPPKSGRWHGSSVYRMLANDVYAGIVTCGETSSEPDAARFPALWDCATHRAVMRERDRRRSGGSPPASPLSGMVICNRCGLRMASLKRGNTRYFRCNRHYNKTTPPCHPNHVREETVVAMAETALALLATDEAIEEALSRDAPDVAGMEREVGRAARAIEKVQEKRKRLALALAEGAMTGDVYRAADGELLADLAREEAALSEARERLALVPDPTERRDALGSLRALRDATAAGMHGWLRVLPLEEARAALLRAGVVVYCEEGKVIEVVVGGHHERPRD